MDERKGVTLSYLRELARKYLREGSGTSRGREFVTALAERVPALGRLARLAGISVSQRGSGDVGGEERKLDSGPVRGAPPESVPLPAPDLSGAQEAEPRELSSEPITQPSGEPRTRPAQVVTFPARAKSRREPDDEDTLPMSPEAPTPRPSSAPKTDAAPQAVAGAVPAPASEPPHAAEPLMEGFFVTKIAGQAEARRHHLLEEQAPRLPPADTTPEQQEHLGVLPLDYQDDAMVLLARDPHTLFVLWDFSDASRKRALDGLPSPRAVLKVFDGEGVSREVDFALESRSYYLQGLSPGRTYRVEAHFVGADGRSRRIGHSSNRATLPPAGPSSDTSIRFLRMPPPPVVHRARAEDAPVVPTRAAEPQEREYVTWRRVSLPGSAGMRDVPEVHRERIETPRAPGASDQRYGAGAHLETGPRAPGASDQRYEEAASGGQGQVLAPPRAPGASDQRYLSVERASGASDQRYGQAGSAVGHRYLEVPRAPGASEQRYGQSLLPGGVSEYRYLEVSSRAAGASDQRYVAGGGQGASDQKYIDVPRAPGASDQRYLTVPSVPGASDQKYLTVPRAAGASDQRYLTVERASGASDQQYLTVPRAAGASDQRYLSVERASGASDQQYLTVPRAAGASEQRHLSAERASGASEQQPAMAPRTAGTSETRYLGDTVLSPRAPVAPRPEPVRGASAPFSSTDSRAQAVSLPASTRVAEPEAPTDPWALSVARGPSASEQRALDKAREAAEEARRAPPASAPPGVPAPPSETPVAAKAAPAVDTAPSSQNAPVPAAVSTPPATAPSKPASPDAKSSHSKSRRNSRRGRS